jgi:hypothetical protein
MRCESGGPLSVTLGMNEGKPILLACSWFDGNSLDELYIYPVEEIAYLAYVYVKDY